MGTTAEKLTYLNTTKTLIKGNLNLGGANISNEPFRLYSSKLIDIYKDFLAHGTDTLWNNWNKVNGTGKSLTLNNTIQAKMKIDLKGNTSQEGTPTPDSPQDIHTVSGDNEIKVENKNLWNEQWENGYWNRTTGTKGSGDNYLRCVDYIPINPNTTIYFTKPSEYENYAVMFYDSNKTIIGPTPISTKTTSQSFTSPINAYYFTFYCALTSGTATYHNNIMINKGTTATPYTPHEEQSLPLNLPVENLAYDGWAEDFVSRINNAGSAKLETKDEKNCLFYNYNAGVGDFDNKYIFKTNWKANTQYTISYSLFANYSPNIAIEYTDGTIQAISRSTITINTWNNITIVSQANKTIKYIRTYQEGGYDYIDLDTFQIEQGTKANSYTPYGTPALEYCKIGDYEDEFYLATESDTELTAGKWYLKKNIGKVVLDGSESWYQWGTDTFYITKLSSVRTGLSNYFKYNSTVTGASQLSNGEFFIHDSANNNAVIFRNSSYTTVADFKTWLTTHNTEVYYVLDTPTYEEITDSTLISQLEAIKLSYNGQTNISQENNDKPFILDVTALGELEI